MFALVDCNNFYVSCERVFRPDLNTKPVVVLSNNDGCVIARSNEAKKIGIPMGAPAFEYKHLFNTHRVVVFSSNYALYGDMSARVMNVLNSFAPEMEIYSIDEAFLKLEGFESASLYKLGQKIRKTIYKNTGMPISIGLADTKALSKVANKIAKQYSDKTKGVYVIDNEEKRIKALCATRIGDIWGIGRRYAKKLNRMGIHNAHQFTRQSDGWVKKNMTVMGLRLKHDLEGKPTLGMEQLNAKKSIATTRSFDQNYTHYHLIKERVVTFAVSCAEKLRQQHSCCNAMLVFLHTNEHRKDLPQYSRNIVLNLPYPTNSGIELAKFAITALNKIFKQGYHYKKAGVIVMEMTPEDQRQAMLFENSDPRHQGLMQVVDKINRQCGEQKIKLASQDLKRTWKMRQEQLSPRYTTRIDEIIKIKA
jgi:DNA polymerase V